MFPSPGPYVGSAACSRPKHASARLTGVPRTLAAGQDTEVAGLMLQHAAKLAFSKVLRAHLQG